MQSSVRSLLKGAAEWGLVAGGLARRARRRRASDPAVLAYHNVIPAGEAPRGDAGLHLPLDRFVAQVEFLCDRYDVVPLESLGAETDPSRPRAAITFDDAYTGALELALPELVERNLPATVFVCPGLLGEGGFWWDRVSPAGEALDRSVRERLLRDRQGRGREILATEETPTQPSSWMEPASVEDLRLLDGTPGVSFASHTWDHPNLETLEASEVREQLRRTRDWLAEHLGGSFLDGHLSFPYGRYDDRVVEIATEMGYGHLYRTGGGLVSNPGASVVPRVDIPSGTSLRGFELRLAGLIG